MTMITKTIEKKLKVTWLDVNAQKLSEFFFLFKQTLVNINYSYS